MNLFKGSFLFRIKKSILDFREIFSLENNSSKYYKKIFILKLSKLCPFFQIKKNIYDHISDDKNSSSGYKYA